MLAGFDEIHLYEHKKSLERKIGDNTRRKHRRLKSEGNLDEAQFMVLWLKSTNAPFPSLKLK